MAQLYAESKRRIMKLFDISTWNRINQYQFFKNFDDPYFGLTCHIDVTNLYRYCKENKVSFSFACLFYAMKAANEITEFRLRIVNDEVVEFDSIEIGSTFLNDDNSFFFGLFQNEATVFDFDAKGKEIVHKFKTDKIFEEHWDKIDLIFGSTIPWISFTAIKHAKNKEREKSGIPKFVFGKRVQQNDQLLLPFSIEVHHALMDGFHVGQLVEKLQQKIDDLR
jgi:chloramphenicol O-acetyltransferase type A